MADIRQIDTWLSRFDAMPYYQHNLSPHAHVERRKLYADALDTMPDAALDQAAREWLRSGKRYPTPSDLWGVATDAYHAARASQLEAPEHRMAELPPPAASTQGLRNAGECRAMADSLAREIAGKGGPKAVGALMATELLSIWVGIVDRKCGPDAAMQEIARLEVQAGMRIKGKFIDEVKGREAF